MFEHNITFVLVALSGRKQHVFQILFANIIGLTAKQTF